MLAKHCSISDLEKALEIINQKFEGNIIFKRLEQSGKNVRFTLRVIDSKLPGHRRGLPFNGKPAKRLCSACWHVHGEFFDALLLQVNENAVIKARDKEIYKQSYHEFVSGNWEDENIGSRMNPLYFSEACDCNS